FSGCIFSAMSWSERSSGLGSRSAVTLSSANQNSPAAQVGVNPYSGRGPRTNSAQLNGNGRKSVQPCRLTLPNDAHAAPHASPSLRKYCPTPLDGELTDFAEAYVPLHSRSHA